MFSKKIFKKKFYDKISAVPYEYLETIIKNSKLIIIEVSKNSSTYFKKYKRDFIDIIKMIEDYFAGNYKEVPYNSIAAITIILLYLSNPFDLIPDFIPVIGYIDDIFILNLALKFIYKDLQKYREKHLNS